MGETTSTILVIMTIVGIFGALVDGRPRYIDCTDSLECGLGFCCVLGNGRFSLPRCVPLGEVDSVCSPRAMAPINVTVSYPDGEVVELTNIHSLMCPCQAGLHCSRESGLCEDPYEAVLFNTID